MGVRVLIMQDRCLTLSIEPGIIGAGRYSSTHFANFAIEDKVMVDQKSCIDEKLNHDPPSPTSDRPGESQGETPS